MANPNKVSISELQRITGVDRATIGKRIARISPEIGAKGAKLYDIRAVLPLIVGQAGDISDKDQATERKLIAEAERAELRVQQLRGELVSVADMKQAAAELIKTLYQRAVRISPSVLASRLVGLNDAIEIETIIRSELATVFDELRNSPEKFLSVEADEIEETEDESESESEN